MVFNGKHGLRALASYGDQKTPEGIKPGSTLAAVRQAYPDLTWRLDEEIPDAKRTTGDVLADVVKDDGMSPSPASLSGFESSPASATTRRKRADCGQRRVISYAARRG